MPTIVTVGIDLAKNVFAVHGVDVSGKAVLICPSVARGKLLKLIAKLTPCRIGIEVCSGAHHWAREFQEFGHTGHAFTCIKLCGRPGFGADRGAVAQAVHPTGRTESDAVKHGLNGATLGSIKFINHAYNI